MWGERRVRLIVRITYVKLGLVGVFNLIPFLDAPSLIRTWMHMLSRTAECYDMPFDENAFLTMLTYMPLSVASAIFGVGALLTLGQWTGIGTLPAGIANSAYYVALGSGCKVSDDR